MKSISAPGLFLSGVNGSLPPQRGRDVSPKRPCSGSRGRLGEASLPKQSALLREAPLRRPELLFFLALLALLNAPVMTGSCFHSLIFLPEAVHKGEWWRLFTHPFVHVTWYHLLLDGAAFLLLYHSLLETSVVRRLMYVLAAGAGSLLVSWASAPRISAGGLCGLSGIAHGLMAVSALELVDCHPAGSVQNRIGQLSFALVVGKAAVEAISGHMFFTFLHFGLMGDPVAASHAGGVIGGLVAMLLINFWNRFGPRPFVR